MKESIKSPEIKVTVVGVFVKDKFAAKDYCGYLFNRGFSMSTSSFECKKTTTHVKVIPMDSDSENVSNRYEEWKFDEIMIPSNITYRWEKLAKSRLRDLNSLIKIYTR